MVLIYVFISSSAVFRDWRRRFWGPLSGDLPSQLLVVRFSESTLFDFPGALKREWECVPIHPQYIMQCIMRVLIMHRTSTHTKRGAPLKLYLLLLKGVEDVNPISFLCTMGPMSTAPLPLGSQ